MGQFKRFLFMLSHEKNLLNKIYQLSRSKQNVKRIVLTQESEERLIKYVRQIIPKSYGLSGYDDYATYIQEFIQKLAHFSLGIFNFYGDRPNKLNHLTIPLFEVVYEFAELKIEIIKRRDIKHLDDESLRFIEDLSEKLRVRTFANLSGFMRDELELNSNDIWRGRLRLQYELVKKLNGNWVLLSLSFSKYQFGKKVEFEYNKLDTKKYVCFLSEERNLFELIFSEEFDNLVIDCQGLFQKIKEDHDVSLSFVVGFVQKLVDNNIISLIESETNVYSILVKPQEVYLSLRKRQPFKAGDE